MTLSSGLSLLGSTWQFIRGMRSRAGHRVPVIRVKVRAVPKRMIYQRLHACPQRQRCLKLGLAAGRGAR